MIDTPSSASVANALSIALCYDGTILVVRCGATPYKPMDYSVLALQRIDTRLFAFNNLTRDYTILIV